MGTLTPSQEHYIKAVYELSQSCDGVRVCDIAEKLRLSKASVSLAIKRLAKQGLVRKDAGHHIYLTEDGKFEAVRILNRFKMIRNYLVSMGVDKKMAEHDACAMEHVVSVDTLCAICRSSGYGKAKNECEDHCPISLEVDEK